MEQVRAFAQEVSEPGFRVSAYPFRSRGRDRIKIEIRSGLVNGRHAWKRAKVCDTYDQASKYIKHTRKHLPVQRGER